MSIFSPRKNKNVLSWIFLSGEKQRLRAGWRLLIQTILMLVFLLFLGLSTNYLGLYNNNAVSNQLFMLIDQGISFFAILFSIILARRFLDRQSIVELGLTFSKGTIRDLVAGFLIAFISFAYLYFVEVLLGWINFKSFAWDTQSPVTVLGEILLALIIFILVGWNEELLSRGYHLQTIASGTNLPLGLIGSSLIFSILHLSNPNANWNSVIGIFLAGLFLGFGYLRTHQLWLPIGLHIGWNFSEGVIFGFPVSGWNGFHIMNSTYSGPHLWTGGPFGPEAGVIIIPALLLGTILIYTYTHPKFSI